jgi:RHS repeat-associated protein
MGLSNTSSATPSVVSLTFTAHGLPNILTYQTSSGSGALASEQFSYDANLRPLGTSATWQNGSGSSGTILTQSRSYDAASNVTNVSTVLASVPGVSNSGGSEVQNFCYDEQNRLVWAGNSGSQPGAGNGSSFVYTHLGQLWQGPLNGTGTQQQYLYCDSSHPHQLTGVFQAGSTCSSKNGQSYGSSYDAWGNETTRTVNATTATLSYDGLDELVKWDAASAGQEQYVYDVDGNRVLRRSTMAGITTMTIYAFGLEEHLYSGTGVNQGNTYYYSLAGHLIGELTNAGTNMVLTDALGSVITTISATAGSAAVQGNQAYGPYGNSRYQAGSMGTAKGFTGQYQDATGLDYYNARYYDPVVGRFLSADTVQGNGVGMDPYTYVGNNPETEIDPTGQSATPPPDNGYAENDTNCNNDTPQQVADAFVHHHALRYEGSGMGFLLYLKLFDPKLWRYLITMDGGKNRGWMDRQVEAEAYAYLSLWKGTNWRANSALRTLDLALTLLVPLSGGVFAPGTVCGQSFTPTTLVATDHGEKQISKLSVGEKVWVYNPQTHKKELQPVTQLWVNHDNDLIDVTLALKSATKNTAEGADKIQRLEADGTGQASHVAPEANATETIHTTQKHPWLTTSGWVKAGDLHLGDQVLRLDNTTAIVTKLVVIPGAHDMYDLTVNQIHTFAVGENQYIVHNCTNEEAVIANTIARSMSQEFNVNGAKYTISAVFAEDPATGDINLYTSLNAAGLKNAALSAKVADMTENRGGTFIDQAYGVNGHAELNVIQSPELAGQTITGVGASNYICAECGEAILAATDGDTSVIDTPIKAPGISRVSSGFNDPTEFSLIPDYEFAPGDEGIIEGLIEPWLL